MNSLHKKREAFRQSIRSRSLQELFARKRSELMHQLKQESLAHESKEHYEEKSHQETTIDYFLELQPQNIFVNMKQYLSTSNHHITPKDQLLMFSEITSNKYHMSSLEKMYLLSKLINREEFALNQEIEVNYGWKNIISEFLTVIINDQENIKRDIVSENEKLEGNHSIFLENHVKKASFLNLVCFSLLKIWEIKPKYEYFLSLTKMYPIIHQKISSALSLTLIAELSYDRSLLPTYSFVIKLLETKVKSENEVKFFRTLEILKNFITQLKVENDHQIHPRQLIFEYFNWVKTQVNVLLDEDSESIEEQEKNNFSLKVHEETSSETKYFLIYLLFTTLKKLSEVNETEKQYLHNKEILVLNEELLNFKENHTLLKFLIFEGKESLDSHHKKNILRTLGFLISFLEISSVKSSNKEHENENYSNNKELEFGAELEEIQRTFQGTDLDWYGSFN